MNAWCLTLTVFVKTSVQMQREQHTFSGLLFLNQGNSNWDCFSVIIMWLTLRHYRTHNSCIFSVIAPSKMWATNPGSVNDTLQDENLLPSVFFRLQIRQFCARRIWCLSPYHIQSKSHCNLNAVFRSTASFFFFFLLFSSLSCSINQPRGEEWNSVKWFFKQNKSFGPVCHSSSSSASYHLNICIAGVY